MASPATPSLGDRVVYHGRSAEIVAVIGSWHGENVGGPIVVLWLDEAPVRHVKLWRTAVGEWICWPGLGRKGEAA